MLKAWSRLILALSLILVLAVSVNGVAATVSGNPLTTNTSIVGPQTATPSMDLSTTGRQVAQLAPTASPQLAAVGLGAVDQTITPERRLFDSQQNIVASEEQLPTQFTPGIIQYDGHADRSAQITGQLTDDQVATLNGYSNRWMNSLRHIWQADPAKYCYQGHRYQAPNDLVTPPTLADTVSELAADRTRVNYGYDHTGDERLILNAVGDTSYGQYVQRAGMTPPESLITKLAPKATGTSYLVGENLFKLSGCTMLEAEVNLFNRMQDMLWGEATDVNGRLEGANEHLANTLNPIFTHVAMGFQEVSPNHWYILWVFEGLSNRNPFTGQQYFSDKERVAINRQWDAILTGKPVLPHHLSGVTIDDATSGQQSLVVAAPHKVDRGLIATPVSRQSARHQEDVSQLLAIRKSGALYYVNSNQQPTTQRLPATGNEQWLPLVGELPVIFLFVLLLWPLKR